MTLSLARRAIEAPFSAGFIEPLVRASCVIASASASARAPNRSQGRRELHQTPKPKLPLRCGCLGEVGSAHQPPPTAPGMPGLRPPRRRPAVSRRPSVRPARRRRRRCHPRCPVTARRPLPAACVPACRSLPPVAPAPAGRDSKRDRFANSVGADCDVGAAAASVSSAANGARRRRLTAAASEGVAEEGSRSKDGLAISK